MSFLILDIFNCSFCNTQSVAKSLCNEAKATAEVCVKFFSTKFFQDAERTREVYKACLDVIPHKKFTFAKVWIMFAHFELRQKDVTQARKIMVINGI